jgi:hypothetical protein
LEKEIVPESTPLTASAEYRKSLAIGLFYKVNSAFLPGRFLDLIKGAQQYSFRDLRIYLDGCKICE